MKRFLSSRPSAHAAVSKFVSVATASVPASGSGSVPAPSAASPATAPAMIRAVPPAWLYGAVVFAAAWLVFWVQPLAVRGVLPVLGGSPAVWNTAMVFFQAALLGGYALAHLLARRATPAVQLLVLGVLWASVALTAPIGELRLLGDAPAAGLPPALWLLGTLAGALGLAFVAASSLTPLVQSWLARAGAGVASADPYFLYAASNAGSAGALVAFPFLLEPFLELDRQAWLWSAAALGLAPFLLILWRAAAAGDAGAAPHEDAAASPHSRTAPLPVARILALSAVPSALLLSITRYLTTDVAAVPLLWIVPLALYLATFVHAFARRALIPQPILQRLVAPALIALVVLYLMNRTVLALGVVHLLVFALAALYCHGTLARLRPPAADLTRTTSWSPLAGSSAGCSSRSLRRPCSPTSTSTPSHSRSSPPCLPPRGYACDAATTSPWPSRSEWSWPGSP